MASILALTSRLLAATGHAPIDQFIAHCVGQQLDAPEVRIELFKATGQMYDIRTVKRWMERYGS